MFLSVTSLCVDLFPRLDNRHYNHITRKFCYDATTSFLQQGGAIMSSQIIQLQSPTIDPLANLRDTYPVSRNTLVISR